MKKRVLALSAAFAITAFTGCDNPLEETTNSLKDLTVTDTITDTANDPYAWSYGFWGGLMDMSEFADAGYIMPDFYIGIDFNKDGSAMMISGTSLNGKVEIDTLAAVYTINDSQIVVNDTMIADYEFTNDTLYFNPIDDEMDMTVAMTKDYSPEDAGFIATEGQNGTVSEMDFLDNAFYDEEGRNWSFATMDGLGNLYFIINESESLSGYWELDNGILTLTGDKEAVFNAVWVNGDIILVNQSGGTDEILEAWPMN